MNNSDAFSSLEDFMVDNTAFQPTINITNIKIATIASFYEDPVKAQTTLLVLVENIYQRVKSTTDEDSKAFTNAAIQYCLDNNLNIEISAYLPIINRIFSDPDQQELTPEKLTELLLHPFILVEDDQYTERYGQKIPNQVLEGNIKDYFNTVFKSLNNAKASEERTTSERILFFAERLNATIGDNN